MLGELLLGGYALVLRAEHALAQLNGFLPAFLTDPSTARISASPVLALVALYVAGALFKLPIALLLRDAHPIRDRGSSCGS